MSRPARKYGARLTRPEKPKKSHVNWLRFTEVSVPEQFVDRGLRPGLFVHPLHDHRAIEARARFAIAHRLAGHRPCHDDRIEQHFAIEDLARFAVDDLRGLADEDAHAENRALA